MATLEEAIESTNAVLARIKSGESVEESEIKDSMDVLRAARRAAGASSGPAKGKAAPSAPVDLSSLGF